GAGLIAFTDLVITAPARAVELRQESERNRFRPVTQERTGIAINQQRRVVEDRFLFTTETLWPGIALTFGGKIQAPITQAEAGLLVASLHLIPNMGRAKSRGLGWLDAGVAVQDDDGATWSPAELQAALRQEASA
ncbi:MAG: hypothetical protein KDE59_03860, partial [Anaerolineales bacterium]|nr:hypothetical protein [Anaerolineales bacterium]